MDDYSRYAWVFFLADKGEKFCFVQYLILKLKSKGMEMLFELFVVTMIVNLKTLFSKPFVVAWVSNISYIFPMWLVGMVWLRGRNHFLCKMAQTMLDEDMTPRRYWVEVVNTACHDGNQIFRQAFLNKTCYDLMHGRAPRVSHFRAFGCRCFILKKVRLHKFESRSFNGIFLGYASHYQAFRVPNLDTNLVMETCEVSFDEIQPCNSSVFECAGDDEVGKTIFEDDAGEDDGDDGEVPTTHVPSTSTTMTTVQDGPQPTIQHDEVEAVAEGEVAPGERH
jgi:hypothetical protein